jgi:LysM domain
MAALNAHLLEPGDHGRLGFRADCPVCRQERLLGALPDEPVISRRAQATLASGLLAFSTAAPGAALAQEADQQQEGVVAPAQPGGSPAPGEPGGGATSREPAGAPAQPPEVATPDQPIVETPGVDPGGETTLPPEVGPELLPPEVGPAPPPAPQARGGQGGRSNAGDVAPPESGPVSSPPDPGRPLTAPDTQAPESRAGTPQQSESAPTPPVPPSDPGVGEAPPLDGGAPREPASSPPSPPASSPPSPLPRRGVDLGRHDRAAYDPRERTLDDTGSHRASEAPRPAGGTVGPSPGSPSTVVTPPAVVHVAQSAPAGTGTLEVSAPAVDPFPAGVHNHVVEPGESLWSIAKRLLEADASAVRIARAVSHLWELNKDRIGTGDPDLLLVGTKLRLR